MDETEALRACWTSIARTIELYLPHLKPDSSEHEMLTDLLSIVQADDYEHRPRPEPRLAPDKNHVRLDFPERLLELRDDGTFAVILRRDFLPQLRSFLWALEAGVVEQPVTPAGEG